MEIHVELAIIERLLLFILKKDIVLEEVEYTPIKSFHFYEVGTTTDTSIHGIGFSFTSTV